MSERVKQPHFNSSCHVCRQGVNYIRLLYAYCGTMLIEREKMEFITLETLEESTPFFNLTILRCPKCTTPWSADYTDYSWMRENDLIVCSCGAVMCEVNDLKDN